MHRDRHNEDSTPWVTGLNPPSLKCTGSTRIVNLILAHPVQTKEECSSLLDISEEQVINQNNVLVVCEGLLVVSFPEDEAIRQEEQES